MSEFALRNRAARRRREHPGPPIADTERAYRIALPRRWPRMPNGMAVLVKAVVGHSVPAGRSGRIHVDRAWQQRPTSARRDAAGTPSTARDRERGGTALRRHPRRPGSARYRAREFGHRVADRPMRQERCFEAALSAPEPRGSGRVVPDTLAIVPERGGPAPIGCPGSGREPRTGRAITDAPAGRQGATDRHFDGAPSSSTG